MEERRAALQRVVELSGPVDDLARGLTGFPWDVDEPLVTLTPDHVADVLRRYLAGALSDADVERWADLLEVRDDVHFDDSGEEAVSDVINLLANPLLHGPLTPARAEGCLRRMGK